MIPGAKVSSKGKKCLRLIVACGGTAGHYLPAASFLDTFRKKVKDSVILVALTKRNIENEFDWSQYGLYRLSLAPVPFNFSLKTLNAIAKYFLGCLESIILIFRFKPDIVLGFGGYASFPIVFFSSLLGIKTVIHEQNVLAGISNKFLSLFVNNVAVSFTQSKDSFPCNKAKIVFTGNPLRKDLAIVDKKEAAEFFGLSSEKLTILVSGGSQGSRKINKAFIQALSLMQRQADLQILHLCGNYDYTVLKEFYDNVGYKVGLFSFLKEIKYAYSLADVVISRAGAGSINEIIYYKIPSVLVPYPYAGGHQLENAKVLQDRHCCIIIDDRQLSAERITELLTRLLNERDELDNLRRELKNFSLPDASQKLSDLVLSLN